MQQYNLLPENHPSLPHLQWEKQNTNDISNEQNDDAYSLELENTTYDDVALKTIAISRILFVIGFCFPLLWGVQIILYIQNNNPTVRKWSKYSFLALTFYLTLLLFVRLCIYVFL
ncbi:hypothetical protein QTN25_008627 [Entamoeba marina]